MINRSQGPISFANWRSIEALLVADLAHVGLKSHPEFRLNWDEILAQHEQDQRLEGLRSTSSWRKKWGLGNG